MSSSQQQSDNQPQEESSSASHKNKFVDIGANLLDDRYQGSYRGTQRHEPDLDLVIQRAAENGLSHLIVTAGTLEESRQAIEFCREMNNNESVNHRNNHGIHFSCTVGVHPTRCQQEFVDNVQKQQQEQSTITDDDILQQLVDLAKDGQSDGTVVAWGELGLDYDRLEFCAKDVQQQYFRRQLQAARRHVPQLPLFLHNRNCGSDLMKLLEEERAGPVQGQEDSNDNTTTTPHVWRGVVHSFDDTLELAQKVMDHGLYIGLNGCSLRTPENLRVVAQLPLHRLLLETDCPYCDVRRTHAGHQHVQTPFDDDAVVAKAEKKFVMGHLVKNRQEPCHIVQVAEIVAGVQKVKVDQVAKAVHDNSLALFGLGDQE